MTRAALILLLAACAPPAHAAEANLIDLRETICERWETRGEPSPDEAVGNSGELGRCQVTPESARLAGWEGKNSDLLGPGSRKANREAALLILQRCWIVKGARTARSVARCYNGTGRRADRYAKSVLVIYAEYRREEAWKLAKQLTAER